jgi:cell division protease FtsH
MSKRIGPVQVLLKEGDPRAAGVSEGMLDTLAEEVRTLVQKCHARAVSLLKENRWHLDSLAQRVLEKETLDEQEIYEAAGLHRSPTPPAEMSTKGLNQSASGNRLVKHEQSGTSPRCTRVEKMDPGSQRER